jgi:hypothetical protein
MEWDYREMAGRSPETKTKKAEAGSRLLPSFDLAPREGRPLRGIAIET